MQKFLLFFGLFFLASCTLGGTQDLRIQDNNIDISSGATLSGYMSIPDDTRDVASGSTSSGDTLSGIVLSGSIWTGATVPSSSASLCSHEVCINSSYPYFRDGSALVQISGTGVDNTVGYLSANPGKDENGGYKTPFVTSHIVIIDTPQGRSYVEEREEMGGSSETIFAVNKNLIVKLSKRIGCSAGYKEEFFDTNGNTIHDPSTSLPTYPKMIQIGKMQLQSNWTRAGEQNMFGFKFSGREDPADLGTVSLGSNYQATLEKKILEESGNGTYHTYVIRFTEIPEVIFYYTNSLGSSEAIIEIPFATNDIDAAGNVISEAKTREILKLYGGKNGEERKIWRSIRFAKNTDDYIGLDAESFLPEMLPVFRVQQFNKISYLLSPAKNYEGFTSAELCKPLVYIYDREQRANSLKVDFPHGGNFTKILPGFTHGQTWNFRANSEGIVTVENLSNPFGYLYYSARVPDYVYNRDGWQIYGRDIRAFFESKLGIIGFNAQEKKDFIDYWVPEFERDTLYFVSFKFDSALDAYVTLDFDRKPQKQMRVLLEAYPVKEINTRYLWPKVGNKFDSILLKQFVRSGEFDVFEWGGTVQKVPNGEIIIH